jgi:hypothetical protein
MSRWVATGRDCRDPALLDAVRQAACLVGVGRIPSVTELPNLNSPALYGAIRPRLLFPTDLTQRLDPAQLRHVLLHECAHIQRRDIALNWLLAVLQAIYWFHPLVWFAFARLRAERELACDEIALQAAGADESEAYGRTILRLLSSWSRTTPSPGVVGILEDRRDLKRRLLHIAEFRPGRRFGMAAMLVVALAGAVTLTDAQTTTNSTASKADSTTNLPPVVPLRYTNALAAPENKDLSGGGNWAAAPRGSNVFGGVHFEIDGLVQLASKSSVGYQREFREYVSLSIPTNRYGSVHLLAATAWSSEANRRIADVIWRYTDGTLKRSPILYTGHVRDWWRRPFEEPRHVYSKFAKAAALWSSPDAVKNGAALRMYRVTLANPEPARTVASLQVQSAMENASLMFLAVSLDPLAPGQRPDPTPDLEPEDPKWTGHLGVSVIDAGTSNVIGGASVVANVRGDKASGERTYTANGSGVADVLTPAEGARSISVTASAKGYSPTKLTLSFGPTNPMPAFVTVRLHGGLEMGGIILDTAGAPIANAKVHVYRYWTGNDSMRDEGEQSGFGFKDITTGPDGRWEASGIPKNLLNRVGLSVTHDDYVQTSIGSISQSPNVETELLEKRHEIRLVAALKVTGIVVNPDGQPVPNAEVRLGARFSGRSRDGKTDAAGRFSIGGQAIGETIILAKARGYGPVVEKLNITAATPEVRLTLKAGNRFIGRVVDPDNQPLEGVWVSVDQMHRFDDALSDELADISTRTGADGRWEWDAGPDVEMNFSFGKDGFARKSGIAFKPNAEEQVVTLGPPRQVEGVVLDEDSGDPVTEFKLEPRGNWWQQDDARSFKTADGRFSMALDKEHYDKFHVTSPTHEPRDEPIPPAVNGVVQMTLRLKKSEDWSGTVVNANGQPIAGVTVALSGNHGGVSLQSGHLESHSDSVISVSGPDGSFKLSAVQSPIAVVAASPDGFGVATVDEFRTSRRVRLLPYGRVEGTYRGRVDDNGTAKLSLQLFTGTGGGYIGVSGDWGGFQNPVTAGGTFSFTRVPAGNHQLVRLIQAGANSWTHAPLKDAPVEPGKTTTVEVTIEGVRVTAQLAYPTGVDTSGFQRNAMLQSASPFRLKPGMTQEQIKALVDNPEFMEAMKRVKHFGCALQSDGSLLAEDIPAGSYDLQVFAFESKDGKPVRQFMAMQSFTIPEGAENGSTLDLGSLPLVPQVLPGETPQP